MFRRTVLTLVVSCSISVLTGCAGPGAWYWVQDNKSAAEGNQQIAACGLEWMRLNAGSNEGDLTNAAAVLTGNLVWAAQANADKKKAQDEYVQLCMAAAGYQLRCFHQQTMALCEGCCW